MSLAVMTMATNIEEQCLIAREFSLIAHEGKLNGSSAIKTIEYVIFWSLANRHWKRVFERLVELIEPMPPCDLIRVADVIRLGDSNDRL